MEAHAELVRDLGAAAARLGPDLATWPVEPRLLAMQVLRMGVQGVGIGYRVYRDIPYTYFAHVCTGTYSVRFRRERERHPGTAPPAEAQ